LTTVKRQTGYSEETCWWETVEGESGPEVEVLTDADVRRLELAIDDLGEKMRRKRGGAAVRRVGDVGDFF